MWQWTQKNRVPYLQQGQGDALEPGKAAGYPGNDIRALGYHDIVCQISQLGGEEPAGIVVAREMGDITTCSLVHTWVGYQCTVTTG